MKPSLRHLWKYQATEELFFRETGYFFAARAHAEICIRCWLASLKQIKLRRGTNLSDGRILNKEERASYSRFLRQRRITCPHLRGTRKNPVIIPWGRNRRHPPEGCIRKLEHSVVTERWI